MPLARLDRKGKPVNWESAIVKLFTGLAFLSVALILAITGIAGGRVWWFWMLIPAFGALGSGIAQIVQIKSDQKNNASFVPANTQNVFNSANQNAGLPPPSANFDEIQMKNQYGEQPSRGSIYDTGELTAPPSVTENTTKHLQIDKEGETMTLPKNNL